MYNLPKKVKFCSSCVMSNQRPSSIPEFNHLKGREGAKYLNMNDEQICDACISNKKKLEIDWDEREKSLLALLDKFRKNNGDYDCLVPGSGGKDSAFASHILKYKYGMNPLTTTWPPILYTEYGYNNYLNWVNNGGFDNILFKQNGTVQKKLTKLSIENLLHPFQTFILGQKNLAPKIAKNFNIDLVFYGENEAEYGNSLADNSISLRDKSYFASKNKNEIYLAGIKYEDLINEFNFTKNDLSSYLPIDSNLLDNSLMEIHYLGYFIKWVPQEVYYYAVNNTGFKPRPFRTQGTYSKYNSIDDKIDDLHYYTTFIKFGIGRATYDASQEIRNNHLNRDEAKKLVELYDGEFPDKYFSELMDYLDIDEEKFHQLCDQSRPEHLWTKVNGDWKLRHNVNLTGVDD